MWIGTDRSQLSIDPYHEMTVAQSRIELDHLRPELFIDCLDQLAGLLCRNQTGGRIIHNDMRSKFLDLVQSAFTPRLGICAQCHHRAAIDHIMFADRDPETGRFERTGSLVVFLGVVSEDGGSHQTAPLSDVFRRRSQKPEFPTLREAIQEWGRSRLKRSPSVQFLPGTVCHPIGMENDILHRWPARMVSIPLKGERHPPASL